MNRCILSTLALMLALLFVSCTGNVPPMQSDYADAVTSINQVDPYYRDFFRSQNGSNYTLADQRKAYLAAMQTARTPVRASEYRHSATKTRLATRSSRKASSNRRAVASRKAVRGKRSVASRRTAAKRGGKARNGTRAKTKRRATASRRSGRARRRG